MNTPSTHLPEIEFVAGIPVITHYYYLHLTAKGMTNWQIANLLALHAETDPQLGFKIDYEPEEGKTIPVGRVVDGTRVEIIQVVLNS